MADAVVGGWQALAALAEGAQADVRACLNALQFLARRCSRVRVADVEREAGGHKDLTRSAFSLWQQLLSSRVPLLPSVVGVWGM